MPARYKTTTLLGQPILSHRKIWIMNFGAIPKGFHVHHKNGDKFDNSLENLELISAIDHCIYHNTGRNPWNKGAKYGETVAYKLSNKTRIHNHKQECKKTYELWKFGFTQADVAKILGISRRQVCDRLRSFRTDNNLQ